MFEGIVTTSPAVESKHWEDEETSMQSALNNQRIAGRLPVAHACREVEILQGPGFCLGGD